MLPIVMVLSTSPSIQILQVLCSFRRAFSDSRESRGEGGVAGEGAAGGEGAVEGGEGAVEEVEGAEEGAGGAGEGGVEAPSWRSSAEMEASSCSCWELGPPGGCGGCDGCCDCVGCCCVLCPKLTDTPGSSSTSISSPSSSLLPSLLLPSPRLASTAPEGCRFSSLGGRRRWRRRRSSSRRRRSTTAPAPTCSAAPAPSAPRRPR